MVTHALTTTTQLLVETDAHEGPVYLADENALYVTTPRTAAGTSIVRIRLDGTSAVDPAAVTVVSAATANANGMALGPDGRLVVCEQGTHTEPARIGLVDRRTGAAETLVDSFRGEPLNSPNDVIVARDGAVWFTDPSYGALQGFRGAPRLGDHVYRHDPATGGTDLVADGFDKPNGLVLSPDESVLYVGDSGADRGDGTFDPSRPHEVVRFDAAGGRATNRARVAMIVPGAPDGLAVDAAGRLYVTTTAGIAVFGPNGAPTAHIDLPGAVNMTFTPDGVLLVTADTAVWAVVLRRG